MHIFSDHNVTGKIFLELKRDDLKDIVTKIGTIAELQNLQNFQKEKMV